jgi:hypothetical protein
MPAARINKVGFTVELPSDIRGVFSGWVQGVSGGKNIKLCWLSNFIREKLWKGEVNSCNKKKLFEKCTFQECLHSFVFMCFWSIDFQAVMKRLHKKL